MSIIEETALLATTPGALETVLVRQLESGGLIRFESAPRGWLAADGDMRRKEHRAYYWTPQPVCAVCGGDGRVNGKTRVVKCKACTGTGQTKRVRVTSVSSILDDILPKPGLSWWAEARGIEGTIIALQKGKLDLMGTPEQAIDIVRKAGLGAEGARDEAAGRGLDIHGLLSEYMETGSLPSRDRVHPDDLGYYRALCKFLVEVDPEPEQVEELVCDPVDGYAGRSDLVAHIHRSGVFGSFMRKRYEFKTSADCQLYPQMHAQCGLYERAGRVCGDEPCEELEGVVFAADGNWRPMTVMASDGFLNAALAWWRELKPVTSACNSANRIEKEARR